MCFRGMGGEYMRQGGMLYLLLGVANESHPSIKKRGLSNFENFNVFLNSLKV